MKKQNKYEILSVALDRRNPFIITELNVRENIELLQPEFDKLSNLIYVEKVETPLELYRYFVEFPTHTLVFTANVLQKGKKYVDILEGATGSSPDSGDLWSIDYPSSSPFTFRGRVVFCTRLTRAELEEVKGLEVILRDCTVI